VYLNGYDSPELYFNQDKSLTSTIQVPSNDEVTHGFPIISDWEENPTQYACQPNIQMVIGDTYNHYQYNLPGAQPAGLTTLNIGNPLNIDVSMLTQTALNREGISQDPVNGQSINANLPFGTGNLVHEDGNQPYLLGLAHWANNLAAKKVRSIFVDIWENESNDSKFRNIFYLAGKYGFSNGIPNNTGTDNWSRAAPEAPFTERMPKGFFQVSKAESMGDQLKAAFASLRDQDYLTAPPIADVGNAQGNKIAFGVTFDNKTWTSHLSAYRVLNGQLDQTSPIWSTKGATKTPPRPREIHSWDLDSDSPVVLTPTSFESSSSRQGTLLNHDGLGRFDGQRVLRLNRLLRNNDDTLKESYKTHNIKPVESNNFLGDILFSEPKYLNKNTQDSDPLVCKAEGNNIRSKSIVSVTANDGLLHVFDAENGDELFTYLPAANFDKASRWMHQGSQHEYWHDGTVQYHQTCDPESGQAKTFIIGHAGRGSSAIYAIELDKNLNPTILWEKNSWNTLTSSDKQQLGMAWAGIGRSSGPKIVQLPENDGSQKSYVVFSSGIVESRQAWAFKSNYSGSIWMIPLDLSGRNIKNPEITLPTISGLSEPNSLGELAVFQESTAPSGATQTSLYVGDVGGRLWRYDYDYNPVNKGWSNPIINKLTKEPEPMFTTLSKNDADGIKRPQSILAAPAIRFDKTKGIRYVIFATGRLLSEQDRYHKGLIPTLAGTGSTLSNNQAKYSLEHAHDGIYALFDENDPSSFGKMSNDGHVMLTPNTTQRVTTDMSKQFLIQSFKENTNASTEHIKNTNDHGWYFPLLGTIKRKILDPGVVPSVDSSNHGKIEIDEYLRGRHSMITPALGTKNTDTVFITLQYPSIEDPCLTKKIRVKDPNTGSYMITDAPRYPDQTDILALDFESGASRNIFKENGVTVVGNFINAAAALYYGQFSENGFIGKDENNDNGGLFTTGLSRKYLKEI
jgi:type IV pilus assembly protein PilY1